MVLLILFLRKWRSLSNYFHWGGAVLDIGCAGGRDAQVFIDKGFVYTGIDLVDSFLKQAKKDVPSGRFMKMDGRHLDFPDNSFDAIWANAILLHLQKEEIHKTLIEMLRVLKPNGKIHVRVKRGKGTQQIAEALSLGKTRQFTFFYKNELEAYVRKAGFTIIFSKILPDDLGRKSVQWITVWGKK